MITFDGKLHVFNVKGGSGIPRVVTLSPKVSCSCLATCECNHVMAARMFLGMMIPSKSGGGNLSQLRRSRREKRVGENNHIRMILRVHIKSVVI